MDKEEFLNRMTDILDAEDDVTMDAVLADIEEWDSLSVVSYVAMANTSCGKKVNVKDVREAVTIQDLYNLLK